MKIIKLTGGAFSTNTYVIIRDDSAVVIDPVNTQQILTAAGDCKLSAILLTHGHFDHTTAAGELKEKTGAKIHIHKDDAVMLNDKDKAFAAMFPQWFNPCEADVLLNDGDTAEGFSVKSTPGHSKGSVLFLLDNIMFSGDTLFANSVGRIDGYGGNAAQQAESLRQINKMNGDYRILPGHGEETTLEQEKQVNFYLS